MTSSTESNDEITGGKAMTQSMVGKAPMWRFSRDRCDYTIKFSNPSTSNLTLHNKWPDGTDEIKAVEKLVDDDDINNINASPHLVTTPSRSRKIHQRR